MLEAIRTDRVKAIQRTAQGPKQLAFHDLAGVGQRPTCVDWLSNNFALQFSSAEVIAAFPQREVPSGQSVIAVTSTGRAEADCRGWLAKEFEADPGKRRNKADFRNAAMVEFAGRLSLRGFNRVWDALAPASGRSTPGRKS